MLVIGSLRILNHMLTCIGIATGLLMINLGFTLYSFDDDNIICRNKRKTAYWAWGPCILQGKEQVLIWVRGCENCIVARYYLSTLCVHENARRLFSTLYWQKNVPACDVSLFVLINSRLRTQVF